MLRHLLNSLTSKLWIIRMTKNNMFAMYEKFLATNLWSPRTSLDITSPSTRVSKKKLYIIILIRFLLTLFMIRAVIAVTLPKTLTKNMICEFFQFYGNPTPIHIGLNAGSLCGSLMCGNPFQYMLYNGKSKIFQFLNQIKNSSLKYNLDKRSERKFKIRLQVISFLCLQFAPNSILAMLYWYIGIIVVYMKEDYNLFGQYHGNILPNTKLFLYFYFNINFK